MSFQGEIRTQRQSNARLVQTLKNLIEDNLEDKVVKTETASRALKVIRQTIQTGLTVKPFAYNTVKKRRLSWPTY